MRINNNYKESAMSRKKTPCNDPFEKWNDAEVDYHRIARRIAEDFDPELKRLREERGADCELSRDW